MTAYNHLIPNFLQQKNRPKTNIVEKKVFIFEQIFAKKLGLP